MRRNWMAIMVVLIALALVAAGLRPMAQTQIDVAGGESAYVEY